jgi:hypothetical protein
MSDPSNLDLPNITMVFAIMEGGKAFMKKMRKEAEQVGGLRYGLNSFCQVVFGAANSCSVHVHFLASSIDVADNMHCISCEC